LAHIGSYRLRYRPRKKVELPGALKKGGVALEMKYMEEINDYIKINWNQK